MYFVRTYNIYLLIIAYIFVLFYVILITRKRVWEKNQFLFERKLIVEITYEFLVLLYE